MNVSGHVAGVTETPLTLEGRKQAKLAGKKANKLGIDYIVSSPMSRALETAQIIAKEIDYPIKAIHTNNLFIERHFGEMEGKAWSPDLNYDGISDIETVDTVVERARLAIKWLHSLDAHNILVVSHGAFGRAIRHHLVKEYPFTNQPSTDENKINNAEIVKWL